MTTDLQNVKVGLIPAIVGAVFIIGSIISGVVYAEGISNKVEQQQETIAAQTVLVDKILIAQGQTQKEVTLLKFKLALLEAGIDPDTVNLEAVMPAGAELEIPE